jgi:drug/metabolite transporter (DMT)-like permease
MAAGITAATMPHEQTNGTGSTSHRGPDWLGTSEGERPPPGYRRWEAAEMNALLYTVVVAIWGSTWLVIKYQLGHVSPIASVVYRFTLAALLLMIWTHARRLRPRFPLRVHFQLALMGILMFSANFVCIYFAEQHLTTGLVAIIFATSLLVNVAFARLFFHRRVAPTVLVGGAAGLTGIVMVFWPNLTSFSLTSGAGQGIVLSLAGTLLFCLGNVVSGKIQLAGVSVISSTGYAMTYGAILLAPWALALGGGFTFTFSATYIVSLAYLALFGSVIGSGAYLTLLGRIGGERAAYATVLYPIVALLLSTAFEHFTWTLRDLGGVALILAGNAIVLTRPTVLRRLLPGAHTPTQSSPYDGAR